MPDNTVTLSPRCGRCRISVLIITAWALMWGWMAFDLHQMRERDLAEAGKRLELAGRMLEGHLVVLTRKMDSHLTGLAQRLHKAPLDDYSEALRQNFWLFPELERFRLSDANGKSLGSSDRYATLDISGRDYFRTLRDYPAVGMVISEPVTTLSSGNCGIVFGRRLEDREQRFAGAVTAVMRCQSFEEFFDELKLPTGSEVLLLSRTLRPIASWPPAFVKTPETRTLPLPPEVQQQLQTQTSGQFTLTSPRDGVERLFHFRKISVSSTQSPFLLTIGQPRQAVLSHWQQRRLIYLTFGALVTLLLFGIWRESRRRYRNMKAMFAREREDKIRDGYAMLNLIPDPAWMIDATGRLIAANVRFQNFKGVTVMPPDSLLSDYLEEEEARAFEDGRVTACREGAPALQTLWLTHHSGAQYPFEVCSAPMFDAQGQVTRFVGIAHELTDHFNAESRQELIGKLFDHDSQSLLILDPERRIVSVNTAFIRLLGYTQEALIGRFPGEFLAPEEGYEFLDALRRPPEETEVWNGRFHMLAGDGSLRLLECRLVPISDERRQTRNWLVFMSDRSEQEAVEAHIDALTHLDSLTGLPNRATFLHTLAERRAAGTCSALAVLNLDHLNYVNNAYGHKTGDQLLQRISHRLERTLRREDLVCRLSDDNFGILLAKVDVHEAERVVDKLMQAVREPLDIAGLSVTCTACVGICMVDESGDADLLLQNATTAMRSARHAGTGQYRFFASEMNASLVNRIVMEHELRQALEKGELRLYYQPQVDIDSGRIVGCEALLRWQHPQKGMVSPAEFIPLAEETGLILPIGRWVLEEACRQNKTWQDAGVQPIVMAVNLSPLQFESARLLDDVDHALRISGLDPKWLELEMTESTLMHEQAITQLTHLKERGIRLSIDDFGTGYSSLSYLRDFPIDKLKIDQSFVRDLEKNAGAHAIVRMVLDMSRELDLKVIAEGVETKAQLDLLTNWRCMEYQGYLCSRPVPAHHFVELPGIRDQG